MKDDDPSLKAQYRMPQVFSVLRGPRNVPKDKQHLPNNQTNLVIAVTVLTDERLLAELLPPDCRINREPLLTVSMDFMANIAGLPDAGKPFSMSAPASATSRGWMAGSLALSPLYYGKPRRPDHDRARGTRFRQDLC